MVQPVVIKENRTQNNFPRLQQCQNTGPVQKQTIVSDFLLLGFSEHPEQQPLLFGLFLGMYLVTLLGNLLIILAIGSDPHLHTPMYFFLANLSFVDTCFTCTIVPKVLVNIHTQQHTISHTGCLLQMYYFMALALLDDFLLIIMAYDRYMAICLPLHYTIIMCPQLLVATSWLCSILLAFSADFGMVASVIYTVVTSMLSPFIYSLRNKDIKWLYEDYFAGGDSLSSRMSSENVTWARVAPVEFILLGITDRWDLRVTLFLIFLPIYLVSLLGNMGLVLLIHGNARLHTPMYFFLANLSLLDACYSSAIGPKMLVDLLLPRATIPYAACALQMFIFAGLADAECCLLAAMAYDRYVAIGNPLLYTTVMSPRLCLALLGASGLGGAVSAFIHTTFTFRLSFCRSREVNSFFCDIPPLLAISCDDTSLNEVLLFAVCGFIQTATVLAIAVSYGFIAGAVVRMRSAEGRRRAASTCGSHLTAVAMLYGTLIFMYLRPSSSYALDTDKMASVFYTLVIPALNPLIYSLRNKEVKEALRRTRSRFCCPGRGTRDWSQEAG
ncbi:olfactory receptor 5C1 [Ictidomys tridecemlineatus]